MRRSKEDAELTRTSILDAAERLFAGKGVQATSMEQIAREAGVTRGAVYWHFRDKGDLLGALRIRYLPPQIEIIEAALLNPCADVFEVLLEITPACLKSFEQEESRQRMYLILECNPLDGNLVPVDESRSLMLRLTRRAREDGCLAEDVSPEEAALSMTALMKGLMTEWLTSGKAFDLCTTGFSLLRRHMATFRKPCLVREAA